MPDVTYIHHADGTRSRVTTEPNGDHHVEREGRDGGHQYGRERSHDDVVKNHREPGERVSKDGV